MAQGFAAASNNPVTDESSGGLGQLLGVLWLVYSFTEIYGLFAVTLGVNLFYPVIVLYLLYFAVARPVRVIQVILMPVSWFVALTALIPILMFFAGGGGTPFAWSSLVSRVSFFALFAGSAVVLLDPNGPEILRKSARISLYIAMAMNFGDLFFENPLNRAEGTGRVAGLYGDANNSAAALGTLLLLSLDFSKQSVRDLALLGLSLLAIVATQSRSGILFGGLIFLVYLVVPRGTGTFSGTGRLGLGFSALLALSLGAVVGFQLADLDFDQIWRIRQLIFLDFEDTSTAGRLERTVYTTEKFLEYFWTGRGLGASRFYGLFPHNAFLEIGLEYGIGGVLVFIGLILYTVIKAFRLGIRQNIGIAVIAFQIAYYSMFSHNVHTLSLFAAFFSAVAVGAAFKQSEPVEQGVPQRLAAQGAG